MSGDRWRYSPEKCDGGFCPCDCDKCPKKWEDDDCSHPFADDVMMYTEEEDDEL